MSLDSVEKLFRKKREELPEDFWRKCVEHVKKIEENYWESGRIQDNKVEQIINKVQMKCFFLFPNLKEQQKSGRLPFTVS